MGISYLLVAGVSLTQSQKRFICYSQRTLTKYVWLQTSVSMAFDPNYNHAHNIDSQPVSRFKLNSSDSKIFLCVLYLSFFALKDELQVLYSSFSFVRLS